MDKCAHEKVLQIGLREICDECNVLIRERARRYQDYADLSHCNRPPPKDKEIDSVLKGCVLAFRQNIGSTF